MPRAKRRAFQIIRPALAVQSRVRSRAFSVWKTTAFVCFPHRRFSPKGLWKTAAWKIPDWRKVYCRRDRFVKCKEKTSTFFFMKGRMSTFLPRTYQKTTSGITACIAVPASDCGKPGGKSEKFIPEWKFHTLYGCRKTPKKPLNSCVFRRLGKSFPQLEWPG